MGGMRSQKSFPSHKLVLSSPKDPSSDGVAHASACVKAQAKALATPKLTPLPAAPGAARSAAAARSNFHAELRHNTPKRH